MKCEHISVGDGIDLVIVIVIVGRTWTATWYENNNQKMNEVNENIHDSFYI